MGNSHAPRAKPLYRYPRSGNTYEGEWDGNLRHGRGCMTWTDGTRYEGFWHKVSLISEVLCRQEGVAQTAHIEVIIFFSSEYPTREGQNDFDSRSL